MSGNTRGAASPQIPEPAVAIVGLLNSRAHAIHPDTLDDAETATGVLRRFGHLEGAPAAQRMEQVRALREDLMAVLHADAVNDDEAVRQAWADFTARTSMAVFQQDFSTPGRVRLRQTLGDPVVGRIALDVADLVSAGSWSRLRACANETCRSVFYDVTRSRTQRWHSYEICGNRANVAAYRSRLTHADTGDTGDVGDVGRRP
jgi:predicted RNA-binding Zn ribbon-like protein